MKFSIKYLSIALFSLLFILAGSMEANAQKKRRKRTTTDESVTVRSSRNNDEFIDIKPWKEKIVWEIGLGNIGFFGGGTSNLFNLAVKPSVGYKLFESLTTGVFLKSDYLFLNTNNEDYSLFDYGIGGYTRIKVLEPIYLKAEYGLQSYAYNRNTTAIVRRNFFVPLVGGGYTSGFGKWKYGFEVLFNLNNEARDYSSAAVEYWMKFDYNF